MRGARQPPANRRRGRRFSTVAAVSARNGDSRKLDPRGSVSRRAANRVPPFRSSLDVEAALVVAQFYHFRVGAESAGP